MLDGLPDITELRLLDDAARAEMLRRVANARVAVLGDFCLDVYWFVDPSRAERSLETGLMTHPVCAQRCSLGGAGNVVNNLVALGCRDVRALGVVGDDPWGREMLRLLGDAGVNTDDVLVQRDDWATLAYNKPHIGQAESNRFDFGNFNQLSDGTAAALLSRLRACVHEVDLVVVNQQVRAGIHTEAFRAGLVDLMRDFPGRVFVADSRHYTESYPGAVLKINDHEAARLCGRTRAPEEMVLREETLDAAQELQKRFGKPIIVTRGSRGMTVADAGRLYEVPAVQVLGPIDTVGAGDSVLAGLALGLAAGYAPADAAQLGNLAAAVTVQKLNTTGTASPDEVQAVARTHSFIFHPELAEDPRRAVRAGDSEIEVVHRLPARRITHAIFDHDGTISSLRQGWEEVMEPMMVRAILGPRYATADESLYHRVVDRVRAFIDETTGLQTLVQMRSLIGMVREFGCVPAAEILDEFGYKAIYNDALMERVRERLAKLQRGELDVDDFVIKGAVAFLRRLRAAGVRLYLASGTDQDDVAAEAAALGYAGLFDGGIHGAVGDVSKEAKQIVLDRILSEIGATAMQGTAAFGDGPVEIREARRRGGLAVGIASDEVRRFGLNPAKRARLIKAGADLIVPDWSQSGRLLPLLGVDG